MVLQAFIDDSGNQPEHGYFTLAGFVSTHDRWAKFADEWEAALAGPPPIEEFKWTHASRLRGHFFKWTEENRDKKVAELVRIIKRNVLLRVHSGIPHSLYEKYVLTQPMPPSTLPQILSPYIFLAGRIVSAVTVLSHAHGLSGPCDLYFDTQEGLDRVLKGVWPKIKNVADTYLAGQFSGIIRDEPSFRDSKEFLPLQAGDLYAGAIRHGLIRGPSKTLRRISTIHGDGMIIDEDRAMDIAVGLARRSKRFEADFPLILLQPYGRIKDMKNKKSPKRQRH